MCKIEGRLITKIELQLQKIIEAKRKEMAKRDGKEPRDGSKRRDGSRRRRKRSNSRRKQSRSPSSERSRSNSSRLRTERIKEERIIEEKPDKRERGNSTHSHSHAGYSEEPEDNLYVEVPVEGLLLKKNFDYILVDKEDIEEYTGRSETRINQKLHVPFHGGIQLVSFMIDQMYADSRLDVSKDDDCVVVSFV